MPPQIAILVFVAGIAGLFWLDRDRSVRTSIGLWIPVAWLWILGSRPVSVWLQIAPLEADVDQSLEGSPVDRLVFTILLLGGVAVLCRRRNRIISVLRANWPIILFFSYCGLSVLWSDYPAVAMKRWIKALGDFVMVSIVLTEVDPSAAVKRFLSRTGFVLIPVSVLLIKYYPDLGRVYNRWTWTIMYTGVTTGKNLLGMMCLILGVGSVWRLLTAYSDPRSKRRTRQLIAHGIIVVMALWLLWTANSVTSICCFFLAATIITVMTLSRLGRKPGVVRSLLAACVCLPVFALFIDSTGSILTSLGRDSTLTGRTAIWPMLLEQSGNPLLGTGFESFWLGDRLHRIWNVYEGLQESHNGYLEVYLNLGWVGIFVLVLLLSAVYREVFSALRRDPEMGRLTLAYFCVALIYSTTEAGFRMLSCVWISLLLVSVRVPKQSVQHGIEPQPAVRSTNLLDTRI